MKRIFEFALAVIIVCLLSHSCKKDNEKIKIESIVKEWTGKKIIFPESIPCISLDKDTTCISPQSTPYKILVYVDSTGCTSCKLHLYKWNTLIREVEREISDLVNFQFYFQPKDKKELTFLFRRDDFNHPVYIDEENKLNKYNNLPTDDRFQTFLLDENNKVVLIGNPTANTKIWELYKKTITGEDVIVSTNEAPTKKTTLELMEKAVELKNLKINETETAVFTIKNTGNNPLIISNISTTCGCTVPEWVKKPVLPNQTTEIAVRVTPDNKGYFRKVVTVFCNTEDKILSLVVKGIVEE